ncbi:hypothetical protein N7526_011509 [Penicillium atrosanguineum]|nr:hypothetical protein N7526_011509 [Penicillium atrosanguineum]
MHPEIKEMAYNEETLDMSINAGQEAWSQLDTDMLDNMAITMPSRVSLQELHLNGYVSMQTCRARWSDYLITYELSFGQGLLYDVLETCRRLGQGAGVIQKFIQRMSISEHRRTIATLLPGITPTRVVDAADARLFGSLDQALGEVFHGLYGPRPVFGPFFGNSIYGGYV